MSLKPSIYDTIEVVASDGRTADIRFASVSIDYYEDILCPTISAKIQIADSGGSIKLNDTNEEVSLYDGMKLRGGERVNLIIEPNSSTNQRLDFASFKPLYVRGIKNVMREESREFFELHLVSREATENEVTFLKRSFSKEKTIKDHAVDIINESFNAPGRVEVDDTSNTLGFIGNNMKPFEALTKLASKACPAISQNASAGFFFFQVRDGFKFKSIDNLVDSEPVAEYVYTEQQYTPSTFVPTPELPSLDMKIIKFEVLQNQDLVKNLKKGAYSTERRFFDPSNFLVTTPKRGRSQFTGEDYTSIVKNLGGEFALDSIKLSDAASDFTKIPSMILTETVDRGTVEKENVTKDENQQIEQIYAQRRMRYNTLFTQRISILVPLNTNISAGDSIICNFPKISNNHRVEVDTENISGKYLVKELCHHFDPRGSWTSMMIVRDTFGPSSSENVSSSLIRSALSIFS